MGNIVAKALPWVIGSIGAAWGAKTAGEGVADGTRNALTICAIGAVLYVVLRKG